MANNQADDARADCWDRAVLAYGTYYLFRIRANSLRQKLRTLEFLGIFSPVLVGGTVLSFQKYEDALPVILPIMGLCSVLQLVLSIWSLTQRWSEAFGYAEASQAENFRISEAFQKLAKTWKDDSTAQYDVLCTADQNLSVNDEKQGLTEPERRKGMRYALRYFKRKCWKCKEVPVDMKNSDCPVCGQF